VIPRLLEPNDKLPALDGAQLLAPEYVGGFRNGCNTTLVRRVCRVFVRVYAAVVDRPESVAAIQQTTTLVPYLLVQVHDAERRESPVLRDGVSAVQIDVRVRQIDRLLLRQSKRIDSVAQLRWQIHKAEGALADEECFLGHVRATLICIVGFAVSNRVLLVRLCYRRVAHFASVVEFVALEVGHGELRQQVVTKA